MRCFSIFSFNNFVSLFVLKLKFFGAISFCRGATLRNCLTSPDPPESVERHISVWKIDTEEKNKNPLNSSVLFLQFSEVLGKSEKIVRIRQGALFFGFCPHSSAFWANRENDFPMAFFLALSGNSFSWISTVVHWGPSRNCVQIF